MSSRLLAAWQRRGPLAALLWPVSRVYAALLGLRRLAYRVGLARSERLPVPVLVVGNVVVGGAGKTPTVIALLRHLRTRGWTPGVISRGYGRQGDSCLEVTAASSSSEAGDEPLLIARASGAPMVVGRRRAEAGRLLLTRHPEVDIVVCDDGMQHWALARDLTVVVFDERGSGNGWLLPAGMLREPWPALPWGGGDSLDELLVLRTARKGMALPPLRPAMAGGAIHMARRELSSHAIAADGSQQVLSQFARQTGGLAALAGIAQPQRFFEMLAAAQAAQRPGLVWLCTEKDAVKLWPLLQSHPGIELWAVPLEQTPEPSFWDELDQALKRLRERLSSRHGRQTP